MRKKINSEAGFSLVELMVVVGIMVLLGLMLTTGMRMALRTYQTVVAQSEVELLLSTVVDTLADDLRYAWDFKEGEGVERENVKAQFSYCSDSFGDGTYLDLDGSGQIVAKNSDSPEGWRVLPTGAYGSKAAYMSYEVTDLKIIPNADPATREITFTICLTVAGSTPDGTIVSASTPKDEDGNDLGVTVRCLNPMK